LTEPRLTRITAAISLSDNELARVLRS